jgi:hypothetical protein
VPYIIHGLLQSNRVYHSTRVRFHKRSHTNPLCRVRPTEFIKQGQEFDYEKEKYREILLEVAEPVLGYFGFALPYIFL